MTYEVALSKAWSDLENLTENKNIQVRFLSDEYSVDVKNKRILSLACNVSAKAHVSILILHYLRQKFRGLPQVSSEWISFKQLEGGEGYYSAFSKRVISPILRKYGSNPEPLLELIEHSKAKRAQIGDYSLVLDAFDDVPLLITLWKADDDFGPEANVLFDKSIKDIFCTEDIVILAEFVAHNI